MPHKSFFHFISFFFFIFLCMVSGNSYAQEQFDSNDIHIDWKEWPSLPKIKDKENPGVAGAFAGISHQVLIIAGGANFPDKPAWQGGPKKYWDKIYIMPVKDNKPVGWLKKKYTFPYPVAYGASLTIDGGILCIGGKNDKGFLSDVQLMNWDPSKNDIQLKELPPLPKPLASLMAANIGQVIYVAGGDNSQGSQHVFYRLNLKDIQKGWIELPAWPGPPLADGVLVAQFNGKQVEVYLIGGRNSHPGTLSKYYNAVYAFDPAKNIWHQCNGIVNRNQHSQPLFAGTGIAAKNNNILLFGGNDGKLFTEIERCTLQLQRTSNKQQYTYWKTKMDSIFMHHPGFDKTIYCYNVKENKWSIIGSLPFPSQLTTTCFYFDGEVIIPSGEFRPGIRTPNIVAGKIE